MTRSIQIIDDDPDDVIAFMDAVRTISASYIVHHTVSVERTIEYILLCPEDQFPHVMFMDVGLPTLNGWEGLREIKCAMRVRQIPVVMFSTEAFENTGITPSDVGVAAFLTRSTSVPQLIYNIKMLLMDLFGE
jgi:DNA-binding NarL/FixJ family response regulator